MTPYYLLCLFLGIILYMAAVDQNVLDYITIQLNIAKVTFEKFIWMVRFHPRNPITNLIMKFKYDKIARELQKEFENKN
jgi:hypothetical protein